MFKDKKIFYEMILLKKCWKYKKKNCFFICSCNLDGVVCIIIE